MAEKEEKMIVDKLKVGLEAKSAQVDVKMEEKVNIAELCAEMVKEEGVEYMFSLVGGNSIGMDAMMQKAGIKRVHMRHEQSAGFAMDAWGRLTGRPGFCVIGPGTGLTNFTTGVVQAYSAGAPGVALVGESGTMDDDKYGSQGCARSENQYRGITKWVRRVSNPMNLLWQLKRAFRSAVTAPTGPTVVAYTNEIGGPGLIVPRKVAYSAYTPGYWQPRVWKTMGDPSLIEKTVKWLLEAERPIMIVGHAAHQDKCQEVLREFVHTLGIPCTARRIARGMISEEDPLNYGRRARGAMFREADRCLVLGLRCGYLESYGQPPYFPHTVRYCQIQDHPDTTATALPTDIEVTGNLQEILKQLIQCVKDMGIDQPPAKWDKWRQHVTETKESYNKRTANRTDKMVHQMPLHPDLVGRYTSEILSQKYKNDYIAIIDGFTASAYFTSWNVAVNTGTVLDSSETIGIGHSPGMAVAAGLATNREKPILALMGDGAVGAGGMDIETCARWNIPVVFLHENNNTLICGLFETFLSKSAAPTGNLIQDSWQTVHNIRYDKMFAEVGCHPEFVERPEEVKPALERAFEVALREKKPAFVECFVDMEVIHSLFASPRILIGQSVSTRWNELPERGKHLIATQLASPASIPMLPKDWQEGITNYQK